MPRVMVVEDQRIMRESLVAVLSEAGYDVTSHERPQKALAALGRETPDVVVTDVRMPGMSGIELLEKVKTSFPYVEVIVMTAYGTVKDAVAAMKAGAFDYLLKPFEPEELTLTTAKALDRRRQAVEDELKRRERGTVFIGVHGGLKALCEQIEQVAVANSTVFIRGESGSGKEVAAKLIHERSPRAGKPFIKVNCAALSAGLLESELFGHTKGAFTGAEHDRAGRFELAHGGTLLLDEVTEIPPGLQAKLLRVLQEREFERVGSNVTRAVDVRVIATSNRDVEKEIDEGRFREDLFFRLNVVPMKVPPLRERREDIPEMVEYFVKRFCAETGRPRMKVPAGTIDRLKVYDWPGNVRELANAVDRAVVLSREDEIDIQPEGIRFARNGGGPDALGMACKGMTIEEIERNVILETLKSAGGHRKKTAEMLGISERSLRDKLRKYRQEGVLEGKT
ncbi:MAG TPA: sigma-54-dependent Fis family transcriptional regulator [Planctomycetes bacterium]|nr:sigma-54-dependent Fis family transcriptional regulator [Planctomycetota bacterium]